MFSAALITIIVIALVYGAAPIAGIVLYILFLVSAIAYVIYLSALYCTEWIKTGEKPDWEEFVDRNLAS